ncbi:MAG: hypothetical protein U1A72_14900 [Sulfuritalea sp.]|nr:hypothetical protein [Sulfuritalea sp.]
MTADVNRLGVSASPCHERRLLANANGVVSAERWNQQAMRWMATDRPKPPSMIVCPMSQCGHYAQFATMSRSFEWSRGDRGVEWHLARCVTGNLYMVFPAESTAMHLQRAGDEHDAIRAAI